MEQIINYVKPELIVVAIALYFIGMAIKQSETIADKYISQHLRNCWNRDLRYLRDCNLYSWNWTGYRNGTVYCNRTGNLSGWIK